MNERRIKAGITQGDINGITYELILKTFEDTHIFETCIPILYGSSKILAYYRKTLELPSINSSNINRAEDAGINRLNIINVVSDDLIVELGKPSEESAKAADKSLNRALEDLKAGTIDILITAPATSDPVSQLEIQTGHKAQSLAILVNDSFRIALATGQVSLAEVPALLSVENLTEKIKTLHAGLIRDFMITFPRIAVLALNPQLDQEEITAQAIQAASNVGILCFGPYAADHFFTSEKYKHFDAALAMYHNQGTMAFQVITHEENILFFSNLPYIVTTPNLHVAFEKAGKNESNPETFRKAIYLAIDTYRNREIHQEIHSNPLKKQYFERGSDNEKLDLTKEDV